MDNIDRLRAFFETVDGYITGPDDGPDKGLGEGGERLHYWVFGGPWSYAEEPKGEAEGVDAQYLGEVMPRAGAVVIGRNMYEAADHWGEEPVRRARLRGHPPAGGGAGDRRAQLRRRLHGGDQSRQGDRR